MKKAFTMIELVFVIVIIGILAAVAIPKLSATRDDAKISSIVANSRTLKNDLAAYYTAQGGSVWDNNATITAATNVNVKTQDCTADANTTLPQGFYSLCDDKSPCLNFNTTAGGVLNIVNGSDTTGEVCVGIQTDPVILYMISASPHDLSALKVTRN